MDCSLPTVLPIEKLNATTTRQYHCIINIRIKSTERKLSMSDCIVHDKR